MKHRTLPLIQNFNELTIIEISKKYKQLATNVVFHRISSIFDPQAIFSVELLLEEAKHTIRWIAP